MKHDDPATRSEVEVVEEEEEQQQQRHKSDADAAQKDESELNNHPHDNTKGNGDDAREEQADEQQQPSPSPSPQPPINENTSRLLEALDQKSKFLCENFAHLTGSLRSALHATSGMSRAYMELYEKSMLQFCDTVDGSVESMRDHVDRCIEINRQLHDMKRLHAEMYVTTELPWVGAYDPHMGR